MRSLHKVQGYTGLTVTTVDCKGALPEHCIHENARDEECHLDVALQAGILPKCHGHQHRISGHTQQQ